jgi:predicted PurR-regulated permease PerM
MASQDLDKSADSDLKAFAKRVLVAVLILAVVLFAWKIANVLLMTFIGILIAIMLRGLAGLVSRHLPISTQWALLVVILILLAIFTLFIWFAGSRINDQLSEFTRMIPTSTNRLEELLRRYSWGQYILSSISDMKLSASQGIKLFTRTTEIATTTLAAIANIIVILFTAIYFSVNPGLYIKGIVALVPKGKSQRVEEVFEATAHTLRYWLLGQAAAMIAVAILTTLGLWLVGVPLAFLLGLIAGLLNFVPFLGAIMGAIPGTLIALTKGGNTAFYALLVYLIVQQLEGNLVTPMAQKQAIQLPPALIILAVVVFGLIFGLAGVLVATPLTVVAIVWIKMLYVHDVLGKPVERR